MVSSKSTPISQGEKNKVISYIGSKGEQLNSPVNDIGKLLRDNFGWSLCTGKIRAKTVIDMLLKEKIIEAVLNNGQRLKSVSLVSDQKPKDSLSPRLVKPQTAPPPEPEIQDEVPAVIRRRQHKQLKKGVAKIRRQNELVGERAESRLYNLSLKLADVLKKRFSGLITDVSVSRSGHSNPRKGRIDLQDSSGEDITILMTLYEEGRYRKERIIYDSKNSRESAVRFNKHIRFYPGQTGAILKKAIVTGKMRSDREIADEILQDMISAEVLPPHPNEDTLSGFGDMT